MPINKTTDKEAEMFGMRMQKEAYESLINHYKLEIERLTKLNKELVDRLMAKSFGEYQVMKDQEVDVAKTWPVIPEAGTIVPYEADAHETG